MQKFILLYFILINIFSFILFSFDKYKSRVGARRTSERRLHTFSLLGGVVGTTLSMILFRHKVSKSSFLLRHSLILIVWIVGLIIYFTQLNELNFLR